MRGLSIVMSNGSLEMQGAGKVIGSFDNFDMDLSITEKNNNNTFKARRMSTIALVRAMSEKISPEQYKTVMTEISTRILTPFMNIILATLALTVLLRSSLLRRRTSFAPAIAVVIMVVIMAAFMSVSNMLWTVGNLIALAVAQIVVFGIIGFILLRK